ncbi:MAG: lipopolysaccharide biosynthesis protein [Candidatus Heimdallarchaeaceae archaeon]
MKKRKVFLAILFLVLFIQILCFSSKTMGAAQKNMLVIGEEIEQAFLERISLDGTFSITVREDLDIDFSSFDGLMILDYTPSSTELESLFSFAGGVIVFIGSNLVSNTSLLNTLHLSYSSSGTIYDDYALPVIEFDSANPLLTEIHWNSVPTLANYTSVELVGSVLVRTSSVSEHPGQPLIASNEDNSRIGINFYPSLALNSEFIEWPYFNYFLYLTMALTTKTPIQSYADWKYSPVPHTPETISLGVAVLLTTTITIIAFIFAKKYSRKNPIQQKDLSEMSKEIKVDKEWEKVGMHRQIGGFLVQLFIGLLIILPNVVMTSLVFPVFILPSPQAAGFYDFTVKFFEALWLFFDIGTSVVLVNYFARDRVKKPQQAVKYIQIFIWYQMLSGVLQLFLISFLGSMIFPKTFLAHLSWMFVTHAFFQWPAFFIVFMLIFQAMNRHDLYQILNLLLYGVLNITLQYLVIYLFRLTLGPNPIFGEGLAGAIGYSIGNYVIQVTIFLIGLWMFKRLGFSVKTIFRVDFSMAEIKESLTFGAKWMLGNILPPLGWFIQLFLLSVFLPNYTQQQGYFSLAWNFALIVMLAGLFAQSMLPGISESFHAEKKALTRYYAVNSLKWGAYLDWFFIAALLAIGPRFIRGGAGPEWEGAAILIPWLLLFHSIGYLSWLGDWMFAGSDRPGWAAISWVIEQAIRAGLLAAFIPQYAFFERVFKSPLVAVMFAYIPALAIKNAFMWWGIRRNEYFKFKWKDLFWQGIIAPLLAAGALYGVLELLFTFIWQGEMITSVIILLIGTLFGLYLFTFFVGLFGGFDKNTLHELDQATKLAKGVKFMARPLYKITSWGCKISPLFDKFKISIFDDAMREADEITKEKAALVI